MVVVGCVDVTAGAGGGCDGASAAADAVRSSTALPPRSRTGFLPPTGRLLPIVPHALPQQQRNATEERAHLSLHLVVGAVRWLRESPHAPR